MHVATRAEATEITMHGVIAYPAAVPSRGSTELATWTFELAAGHEGLQHSVDREEVFMVQSGRVAATIGEERVEAGPGDALIVQPGEVFGISNPGSDTAQLMVCTSKGIKATTLTGEIISPPWAQ